MILHLILGSAALMGAAFTIGLAVVIAGIHRSEHGKRLTGKPAGRAETFAQRLLTGSRGYSSAGQTGGDAQ
jgi:hypothetical protein